VFEFDYLCSTTDCLLTVVSESAAKSVSPIALELKSFPDSLKYTFLGPDESLLLHLIWTKTKRTN